MDLPRPLARTLGLPAVLFLTLSISTPASSVFVILPGMVGAAGSGALLALLIAILICLATGVVYAELASAWPVAGGEYVFVAHTLGPAAGFAMLVVNLFNTLLFPPVVALGIAAVASSFMPGLPVVPVAIAVLAAATQKFGCGFIQFYGMTETTGAGTTLAPGEHRGELLRSCGRPWATIP